MTPASHPLWFQTLLLASGLALGCQANVEGPGPGGGNPTTSTGGSSTSGTGGATAGNPAGGASGTGMSGSAGTPGGTGGIVSDTSCIEDGTVRTGRSRLRRMTRSALNHTVRDLIGATGSPSDAVSPDESIGPFYSNAIAPITDLLVQQYDEVAAALADQATARMSTLSPCDLAADTTPACATQFIESFGLKAYRRPLDPAERDEYLALYTLERGQGTAQTAFKLVVATFLESPFFLYHSEVGASGVPGSAPSLLSSYEIASRLSYFLWDTMPDDQLFSLAQQGMLTNDAVIAEQVTRMLADPRAADAIPQFHLQWLGIRDIGGADKDTASFPTWNPALGEAMQRETATFADFVVRRGDGLMRTLFTANFTFPEGPLFGLYGLTQPQGFAPGTQVTLTPERAGILTQGAFLATHAHRDQTSPVHRGIMVRENILCEPLEPPPLDVNTTPPAPTPATTTRERFAQHEANPTCGGCHVLIDPIGLAFEHFDAIGAYRTMENGFPIDASGEIFEGPADLAGPFNGALELGQRLSQSRAAADCMANQWFRFALGRMEAVDDACSLKAIRQGFEDSGRNVRDLIVSIVKSDAFRHVRSME
jgi:hypothetical protein